MILKIIRDRKSIMNTFFRKDRSRGTKLAGLILCMSLLCVLFSQCVSVVHADDWEIEEGNTQNTQLTSELIGYKDGFSATLYDNSNGLPTSEANDIVQSDDGFLWIGSYAGLVRYDGNTFERMDSTSGITSVKCLHNDSKGRLWIGTNESGLFLMKDDYLRQWKPADGLGSASVRAITEDKEGRIYIGTTGGLTVLDQDFNATLMDDPGLDKAFIQALYPGKDGKIYGITNAGDGFVLENGKVCNFLSHENNRIGNITALYPDPEKPGYIYCETDTGIMLHKEIENTDNSYELVNLGPLYQVLSINYINNRLWFCCRNGIGIMDNGTVHVLENVPMNNSICKVTNDYEGNLWFASTRQGVMKICPNQFSDINAKYNLETGVVNSTCILDDQLFIATDTGLIVLNSDGSLAETIPVSKAAFANGTLYSDLPVNLLNIFHNVRIRSIMKDSKDRLWFSCWRLLGTVCYDHGEVTIYSDEDGLYSNNTRRVVERDDGSYIVAVTGGVNVIKDGKVIAGYNEENGIENTETLSVETGKNGDILLGSDGGGIFILSQDGTARHIGAAEGLTSEAVMRIKYDELHDVYWVVTGNSLAWLSSDYELHTVSTFPYSNNFDIYRNKDDMMWILSSNGIYVASATSLLNGKAINPMYYGISNGLPCIATANSYSHLTEEGDLYIAGSTGVARVNINTPYVNISNLKASVPFIDADEKRIYPDADGGFTIDSSVRKLVIHPHVFNYSLMDPQVTYRLKGFDNRFITVKRSELGPIAYTNLSGGDYSFVIQMIDQMGGGNKVMSIRITKTKSFTENIWFYIVFGLGMLGMIIAGVNSYVHYTVSRLEKKHREESEKERIKSELDTASGIQQSLLPHQFPPYPDRNEFNIYALMNPAREVGGDFYDYFLIDDDHLCLVIADVSGKGIPAALFMMMSKIIVQSYANTGISPAEILSNANETLSDNNPIEMFVTVWLGILEISTGKLTAANAGHEYPYIMKNGQFSMLKDKHGFVIGGMKGVRYKEYEVQLEPGDRIFVYTDGVPEATNAQNAMFQNDNLLKALNKDPEASPEQILANVNEAVNDFVKDAEQFDDLTMLCLEYKGKH